MIRGITFLCFLLVICAYIEHNHAATKVFYEFHIRDAQSERNETGALNTTSNSTGKPELIITGTRTSQVILNGKDENSSLSLYKETAFYTADDSGYHVNYNISTVEYGDGPRLGAKTLKVIVG